MLSPRLCAASVLMTSVRYPRLAHLTAVAAATVVFPTPPLPVYRITRTRVSRCSRIDACHHHCSDEDEDDHERGHDRHTPEIARDVGDAVERDRGVLTFEGQKHR